jgi:hypothetical protein
MTPAEMCALPIIILVSLYTIYVWIHELTDWFGKDDVV